MRLDARRERRSGRLPRQRARRDLHGHDGAFEHGRGDSPVTLMFVSVLAGQ